MDKRGKYWFSIPLKGPFNCKLCSKILKTVSSLSSHIIRGHGYDFNLYLIKYYDLDILKMKEDFDKTKHTPEKKEKQIGGLKKYIEENVKGVSIEDRLGQEKYSLFKENMKGMFSLEWFIKKYGEIDGLLKYDERSLNISKNSAFRQYNTINRKNFSKISQELFWSLMPFIENKYEKIYFSELNHEYSCELHSCNFDFVVKDIKKIIEFNGDKWHGNPNIYKENEIPFDFVGKTAKQLWEIDKIKINKVKQNGYKVLIIWESEYLKNKEKIKEKCLKFILE